MSLDRVMKALKKEHLVRLTQDLIRIPSVRREGEKEERVALLLSHLLEEEGLDVVVETVEPGSPNVIAVLHGQSEGPCLMFEGHTDVVTEGDVSEWKYSLSPSSPPAFSSGR